MNDLLNLVLSSRTSADDITLSELFSPEEKPTATVHLNVTLHHLCDWDQKRQVTFVPTEKTKNPQLMVAIRTNQIINLSLNGITLEPQRVITLLGVTCDNKLPFVTRISTG